MKKILATILALACLALPACKKEEAAVAQINGFETYDEVRLVKPEGAVCSLEVNTDKAYITSGEGSMKFRLERTSALATEGWVLSSAATGEEYAKNVTAALTFTPKSEYNQLAKVNAFSVDIYNANEYDAQVILYACDVDGNVTFASVRTLVKGGWSNLNFPLNGLFYENATKLVSRYRLAFVGNNKNETYYLDNFVAELGTGGVKAAVEKEGSGKILSFNKESDLRYCNLVSYTQTPAANAYYSANPDFSQTGGALCIETMPYSGTEANRSAATHKASANGSGVQLYGELLSGIPTGSKILVDAYVANANGKNVNITLSDGTNTQTQSFAVAGGAWQTLTVEAGKVDVSKLTQLVVTVDTTESTERVKVYLDDLRYE
ncbi:MAG: hypothetical protein IJ514_02165 [Clostridia bacterium]|nr:hypothetical protein [Clostridia bacterium]